MKQFLLLLALTGFISLKTTAQNRNWSTIQETDTPYFAGGIFEMKRGHFGGSTPKGQLIRRIYIDSVRQGVGQRTLFFPKTLRGFDTSHQIWPGVAYLKYLPGWQGPFCLQKGDSLDEFYNFRGDTIRVHIQAAAGATWTLTKDSSGAEIRAQIIGVGMQPMGGGPDSFREAILQAYRNGVAVAHIYNNRKLRWTKTKGWVKTLDWFAFPYRNSGLLSEPDFTYSNYAAQEDTASYDRIADTLDLSLGSTLADLQNQYQPGNAWRNYTEGGYGPYTPNFRRYVYDSVLAITALGNQCVVQIQSSSCEFRFRPPTGGSNPNGYWQAATQSGIFHTDTLTADTSLTPRRLWITPDEGDGQRTWSVFLITNTICGKPVITKDFRFAVNWNPHFYLTIAEYGRSGVERFSYIPGGGTAGHFSESPFSEMNMSYQSSRLEYFRTHSCTYGNYIDVPSLLVGATAAPEAAIALSPNPADEVVFINIPETLPGSLFSITNLQGKSVLNGRLKKGHTAVSVAALPAGFYLVKVWGAAFQQVQKLLIQR